MEKSYSELLIEREMLLSILDSVGVSMERREETELTENGLRVIQNARTVFLMDGAEILIFAVSDPFNKDILESVIDMRGCIEHLINVSKFSTNSN